VSGLSLHRVGDTSAALDALAARSERVGLVDLLDDLPRRLRRSWAPGRAVHEAWRLDGPDQVDLRWWPQGITTVADAAADGDHALPAAVAGRRVAVMSSYAKQMPWHDSKHGSRLTFLDLDAGRYRHVLLVRPTAEGGLEPLNVHAGGVVWHGDHVHVAATGRGLFTCRLSDLLRVPDRATAYGYRYVLPVRHQHQARAEDGVEKLRYSFLSLDVDSTPPTLLVGEYTNAPGRTRRLARVGLDLDTADVTLVGSGPLRMQGAVEVDGRVHLSVSEGRVVPGSMYTGTADDPDGLRHHRLATPMGNEDLSYSPAEDLLYGVAEHPSVRYVFTMRRSWFD
jgi:hypothetical protein